MDRDEALRLLTGGPEGVAEWNRRREAGEGIPDLREARLDGARLDGARLNRASLDGAILNRATCHDTIFADVDLSGVEGLESMYDRHRHAHSLEGKDPRGVPAGLRPGAVGDPLGELL